MKKTKIFAILAIASAVLFTVVSCKKDKLTSNTVTITDTITIDSTNHKSVQGFVQLNQLLTTELLIDQTINSTPIKREQAPVVIPNYAKAITTTLQKKYNFNFATTKTSSYSGTILKSVTIQSKNNPNMYFGTFTNKTKVTDDGILIGIVKGTKTTVVTYYDITEVSLGSLTVDNKTNKVVTYSYNKLPKGKPGGFGRCVDAVMRDMPWYGFVLCGTIAGPECCLATALVCSANARWY